MLPKSIVKSVLKPVIRPFIKQGKQSGLNILLTASNLAIRSKFLRRKIIYQLTLNAIELDSAGEAENWRTKNWELFDPIYSASRRELYKMRLWRYGPLYVRACAKKIFDDLIQHTSIANKVYCELGCGEYHPYGVSSVMYMNGIEAATAIDLMDTDEKRAAEALHDLVLHCITHADDWHWGDLSRKEYLERAYSFDIKALSEGDLKAGVVDIPIKHIVANIYDLTIPLNSIDIMSSWAVLEHLLDFELACNKLFSIMSPGGIAYHLIDLADHRGYRQPQKYHFWSFLGKDQRSYSSECNRLRCSEVLECFERTGFEVLCVHRMKEEMPKDFRQNLDCRFAEMSDEELNTIHMNCVLRKS
jgi:hypothetical protein